MYTVKQLSDLAGVSVRTLHHYDSIALLKPSRIGDNGYRYYGEEAVLRLQQILLYRELDLDLATIKRLLERDNRSLARALARHRAALLRRIGQLEGLVATVDKTIMRITGELEMSDEELFENLSPEQRQWSEEAMTRWDPAVVRESHRRYNALSDQQRQALQAESGKVYEDWARLIGSDPAGEEARAIVRRWRSSIEFFWTPDEQGLIGLAEMYGQDERFRRTFDKIDPRLCGFILECVQACDGHS